MSTDSAATDQPAFVVTRTVAAPIDVVWRAWTDPALVRQWWGPQGWTCPVADMNVVAGQSSVVAMRSPDGHDIYNRWTYSLVDLESRLEYAVTFADAQGVEVSPSAMGLPAEIPDSVPHVVTFTAVDGGTSFSVAEFGYPTGPILDMSRLGQEQCMDKLVAAVTESSGPR